ncbi:hypothetical protein DTO039G3_5361 [Penicillium roqueforti]|nr:hypothetical protein LCP963914a_2521 [Penicillium roqueforti]KAI2724630.1 hypothetical protein CBS147318_1561 [Penicillium roqueforti]KAI3168493.1 hypothetical protein DTO039G3_5361 [Penicillium roqueforti]
MRLVRSQWVHEYDPTIEDSYSVTRAVDGRPYVLSITDTAGQEEYRGLWSASTLSSDAFLLVYDITNPSSLETLDHFMEMIDMEAEQRVEDNQQLRQRLGNRYGGLGHVGMPPPVKVIAGNKCDLKDGRAVTSRDGLAYARKHGCGFMETSARETVNIEETFARMTHGLSTKKERERANGRIDLIRRVVEARRLQCQQGVLPPSEPSHTALPTSTVDAVAETKSRRSRAWEFIKHRKTTEPNGEQGQEQSEMQNGTEKEKGPGQGCEPDERCARQVWCFRC